MLRLVVKECLHCGQFIENCEYQRWMRSFGVEEIADTMTREVETPPWTSSRSSENSQSP